MDSTVDLSVTRDAWQRSFRFALANATVFLFLSLTLLLWEPASLPIILSVPVLFFFGSMMSFVLLIRSGGAFAAVAWFIFGAGVYFGLGVFLGGLAPDPRTIHSVSEWLLYRDLIRVNLLNSSSVIIALLASIPLSYALTIPNQEHRFNYQEMIGLLVNIFPLMAALGIISVGFQFLVFPVAKELLIRTFLNSFYMIIPFCILTLGMLWTQLQAHSRGLGVIVLLSAFVLSLLSMSKFSTISIVLAFVVGVWLHRRSVFSLVTGLFIVGAFYVYLGELANAGRMHRHYDAEQNSPLTRLQILSDTILLGPEQYRPTLLEFARGDTVEVPSILTRFSITAIQSFLVEQYESGNPGTTLSDFWVAAIPRVLWPEKPIVTRFGAELHAQFWDTSADSAFAPTYTGEAYWNYGPVGLVIVSIFLGLQIGWLTRRWHIAARGSDAGFFLIAFPVSLWAAFVESWIAASYIGGFLTIVVLWFCTRLFFLSFSDAARQRSLSAQTSMHR